MEAIDFRALVDRAASRVEREDGAIVSAGAREELVARAHAHEAAVYEALARERLGESHLEDAAVAQLRQALATLPPRRRGARRDGAHALVAPEPDEPPHEIDAAAVRQGMAFSCHWIGWC